MNRYMNDPCIIGPEIFFPLNISLDRKAEISDCSEGSLSPTFQITHLSVTFLIDDWGGEKKTLTWLASVITDRQMSDCTALRISVLHSEYIRRKVVPHLAAVREFTPRVVTFGWHYAG